MLSRILHKKLKSFQNHLTILLSYYKREKQKKIRMITLNFSLILLLFSLVVYKSRRGKDNGNNQTRCN